MPGGGVEWGEHPDAAVLRELEEEAGITDVRDVRVAAIYSHVYERSAERPDSFHVVGMIYEVTPGSVRPRTEPTAASGSPSTRPGGCRSCR